MLTDELHHQNGSDEIDVDECKHILRLRLGQLGRIPRSGVIHEKVDLAQGIDRLLGIPFDETGIRQVPLDRMEPGSVTLRYDFP